MEFYLLEQLDAFARCGTLTRAAEELHISQPALSRSMKKIEEAFGVSLFTREKSKIALNETGKVAADYARRLLELRQEMMQQTAAFDRNRRSLILGACAPMPITRLIPVLQQRYSYQMISSETVAEDARLIAGLKNRSYHLAVLHHIPEDREIVCQHYLNEQLYIALPRAHPMASRTSVRFSELAGFSFLVYENVGFWVSVCRENIPDVNLIFQDSMENLAALAAASTLPSFGSDQMMGSGHGRGDRVFIPIEDAAAHASYYLACLQTEKRNYAKLFQAVRTQEMQA